MSTTITVRPVEGTTDLHHRYPRQTKAQPCHVELDCETGDLSADYDHEIGNAVPARVYHLRAHRWSIPALRADAANALLEEIAPLAQRVADGYTAEWDGSNHVGTLDDDAADACAEIERLCDRAGGEEGDQVHVWTAEEWFAPLGDAEMQARELGISAETTDAELSAIVEREIDTAENSAHADEIMGVEEYLEWIRREMRDAAEVASSAHTPLVTADGMSAWES